MFAGITNLLWGSSAPAPTPAPEEPAALDDYLCKMEVGSDTGCSDEEMVHLPKPNSDVEEDWVVVAEGRSGKKEALTKKKRGAAFMDQDGKVEVNDVLKSGDQFMMEDPEKSRNKAAEVMRVESKIRNGELKAWNVEPKRVSPEPALVLPLPKKAVSVDKKIVRVERKNSMKYAHNNSFVETAVVEVEPKLAKVERKMEKMNLSRMRVEQKRGRVESKLRNTDAKRAKGEPKIFKAKTDIERTETETVQEVDAEHQPKRVTVQPKLVTEELELVKAQPVIVTAKPEILIETMPEMIETKCKTVIMPEIGSDESKRAITKEQIAAKEKSEHDDAGFQLVHSRYNRFNCCMGAKTRKEAIEFYLRQGEKGNLEVASAVLSDEMRIEPKTIVKEVFVKLESEEVKVDEIDDNTETDIDGTENKMNTSETNEIGMKRTSVTTAIKSPPRRQRRTRVRSTWPGNNTSEKYEKHFEHIRNPETARNLVSNGSSMCLPKKKTRSQASCDDYLEFDEAPILENHSKPRSINEGLRELMEYARLDTEIPESSPTPSQCFWPFRDVAMTRRGRANYSRMLMMDPLATPSDRVDEDIELLCNMLNDKQREPSEVEAVMRLLNAKLNDRREEMQKELHFNKEYEARAAERELKKEEQRQETRLTQKAVHPVEHRRLSRKIIQKNNAARLMSSAGNGRLRRSDRLQPRNSSGANNNRKCC